MLAGIASGIGSPARAGTPVRMIVPYPAGGTTDQVARLVVPYLARQLKATVIVDNRPGASGSLGMQALARAAPDGTTLGLGTVSTLVLVPASRSAGYDPMKSFDTIGSIGAAPFLVAVNPDLGITDLAGLIRRLKESPGSFNYGTVGEGSLPHVAALRFQAATGTRITHIPYTSAPAAKVDLISGRIELMFDQLATFFTATFRSGALQALAVMSDRRLRQLPDVPTVDELGLPGLHATMWLGLLAPSGLDPALTARLNAALQTAVSDPAFVRTLDSLGMHSTGGSADAFHRFIEAEVQANRIAALDPEPAR